MKKFFVSLAVLFSTSLMSHTAFAEAPKPGEHFTAVAQPIATDNPAKIEVMEVFWYGCIHCYQMDPLLNAWVKKQASDVVFKRIPALPNASWAPMAKTFYAMETLGVSEKLHTALFDAINKQKTLNPTNEKAAIEWVTKAGGLDKSKVEQAFKSFTINTNLNRAAQIFRASGATGVPSLIIDGKYITSSTMAGGNEQALRVTDYIVDNVRKDKSTTKIIPAAKK